MKEEGLGVSGKTLRSRSGYFPKPECTNPPKSVINLAEDQISGGLKAGALPVKDYNACTT